MRGIEQLRTNELLERDGQIHDFTKNGKCSNCGGCCNAFIPMNNGDINRIKNYIKKNNIKPIKHIPKIYSDVAIDTICPFRDSVNEICTIYEVRPTICRSFVCNKAKETIIDDFDRHPYVYKDMYNRNAYEVFFKDYKF